jgi:hypothetical protein
LKLLECGHPPILRQQKVSERHAILRGVALIDADRLLEVSDDAHDQPAAIRGSSGREQSLLHQRQAAERRGIVRLQCGHVGIARSRLGQEHALAFRRHGRGLL